MCTTDFHYWQINFRTVLVLYFIFENARTFQCISDFAFALCWPSYYRSSIYKYSTTDIFFSHLAYLELFPSIILFCNLCTIQQMTMATNQNGSALQKYMKLYDLSRLPGEEALSLL